MVKPRATLQGPCSPFESDVVPDSGKTPTIQHYPPKSFESDVVPDSGKTGKGDEDVQR